MDASRAYNINFKSSAYEWKHVFSDGPQRKLHAREDDRFVDRLTGIEIERAVTTETIVAKFINNFAHDEERYAYRKSQLEDFFLRASITEFTAEPSGFIWESKALLDDRNNWKVNRLDQRGSQRTPLGPINARQLYHELRKAVRLNMPSLM